MLRINHRGGAASASYYTKVISQSYYGQENPGFWHGLSAQMLGYQDGQQINPEDFVKLCHSINPNTDERLNIRQPKRATYDFTFSVPKSVSIEAALGGDKGTAIQEAFRESVIETMQEIEQQIATRVRTTPGSDENRTTGNMIWGEFLETTTRPVDGIPDPHLHIHAVAISTTWDHVEERRKAAQFGDIKRDAPYYQAVVDARLANKLTDLGYEIRRSTRQVGNRMIQGWELAHTPDSVMQTFSRRTQEIEQMAIDQGYMTEGGIVLNPEGMAKLGETTREHKVVLPPDQLIPTWESWLLDAEKAAMDNRTLQNQPNTPGVTRSLDYALEHLFQNNSTTTERQLITHALTYGVGWVTPEEIQNQIQQRDDILTKERDGKTWLTTQKAWDEEREMISLAMKGRGTQPALNLADTQHEFKPIVKDDGTTFELNAQQQAAVRHVWQSNDFVTSIRGGAGVGKTTLLQEAVAGITAGSGKSVFTFAPSSDAVKVLQEEGFHNADTVQQLLLQNPQKQLELRNSVLLIDEAGLMGSRQMNKVFKMAKELDARVILSGDARQHRAVERGDSLRILEHSAGVESAEVTEITRQRGAYKKAVEAIGVGDVKEGFKRLDRMGAIQEITDGSRHEQLTKDYLKATRRNLFGKRYTALVVAPTHAEGDSVTRLIREELKELANHDRRKLGDEEHSFTQLRNLSYTEAEREDPFNYAPGQVVQFVRRSAGFATGERFTVVGRNTENHVVIRDQNGLTQHLDLAEAEKFQVYQERTLDLATGDKIRITQNGWSEEEHRLTNGAIYDVAGFSKDQEGEITGIRLANGWAIGKEFGHLAHGYVVTSHASQGKTVDHVLIAEGAESFPAASLEQFYVSVSRGKRSVSIYTDDKEALLEAVEISSQRLSATELMQENQRELEQDQEKTVEQWVAMAHTDSDWMKQSWPDMYQAFAPTAPTTLTPERVPELER